VCSTGDVERARSIGADPVMDYTREDFTQSGQHYDLILAANAYHSIFDYRRALSQDGIYVMAGAGLSQSLQATLLGPFLLRMGSSFSCIPASLSLRECCLAKMCTGSLGGGSTSACTDPQLPCDIRVTSNLVIHRQKSRSCSRWSGSCGDREERRRSFVVKISTSKLLAIKILQSIFADSAPVKGFRRRGEGGELGQVQTGGIPDKTDRGDS
jgi:hypothetical protein